MSPTCDPTRTCLSGAPRAPRRTPAHPPRTPRPSLLRQSADNWLFPGGLPGRHLATENVRAQLVERGIQPADARKAAMFSLPAEIPTPVLAELLGLSPSTATRWATLAAHDWSQYAAPRRNAQTAEESTRR